MEELDNEDETEEHFYVDPENGRSVTVFRNLSTQWNVISGMAGDFHVGLKYEAILPVMHLLGIRKKHHQPIFADLRVMEAAAKSVLNEKAK